MHTERTRILVVHRNRELTRRLRERLDDPDKFELEFLKNIESLGPRLSSGAPDVIVLDPTLLVPPAFTIYRILESRSPSMAPVVIFRARSAERTRRRQRERWHADAGIETLETCLHSVLGRIPHRFSWLPVQFSGSHLTANLPNTHVAVDGRNVSISAREGEVLGLLIANCNQLVRRELLISEIWGYETRSLDVYVRRLRQKLGAAGAQVETVTGFGYRFVEPGFRSIASPAGIYPRETGSLSAGCMV